MLAVLRLRGRIGIRKDTADTMRILGLDRKHALALHEKTSRVMGMIKKSEDYVTWGEASVELLSKLREKKGESKIYHLAPPRKGLKSLKKRWPKGDLGHRGDAINELIERML